MGTMPYSKGYAGIVKHVMIIRNMQVHFGLYTNRKISSKLSVSDEISRRKSG